MESNEVIDADVRMDASDGAVVKVHNDAASRSSSGSVRSSTSVLKSSDWRRSWKVFAENRYQSFSNFH